MEEKKNDMLAILQGNKGFDRPEQWIDYGMEHNFKPIKAVKLDYCPDCGNRIFKGIGQYIYFSTLIKLMKCKKCGLILSDTLIDPQEIQFHFEYTYKDEEYFQKRRNRIFNQIARLVDKVTPPRGSVLDIGGAKGHLLSIIKKRRGDLKLVLNDLSKDACDFAANTFTLDTVCCNIEGLGRISSRFSTVLMIDVLYYMPDLNEVWKLLPHLVAKGGAVVIRVPNKFPLILFFQRIAQLFASHEKRKLWDRINFFNPEHIYVFTRDFLVSRLRSLGFSETVTLPSELLVPARRGLWHAFFYRIARALWTASHGKIIITPGFLVVASSSPAIGEVIKLKMMNSR
jgi:SAM-dependent methyltransferase